MALFVFFLKNTKKNEQNIVSSSLTGNNTMILYDVCRVEKKMVTVCLFLTVFCTIVAL